MKTPPPSQPPPKATPKDRGRFVGLVATGKERYQVILLETLGDEVVKREVLAAGRTELVDGAPVTGDSLANAFQGLNVAVIKRIREASDLWQKR